MRLSGVYRFGAYEADTGARELRKHGVRIPLGQKPFDVLVALLERPGQVVTRKELRLCMWPTLRFLEFDDSINSAVHRLREALSDNTGQARFIETLPRIGYRFIARLDSPAPTREGAFGHTVRLLVLPLENLSGDPAQEYFSDGLTEEMITQLASLAPERLGVIARTSAMHYKGSRKTVAEIAHDLRVDYVLEGSVRRAGDHVRISTQLIRAADETHLWAKSYEGELRDVLRFQREASEVIARQIETSVPLPVTRPLTGRENIEPAAYDAYIKGLYHLHKFHPAELHESARFFELAIQENPAYVEAYANLARVCVLLGFWNGGARAELMRKAEQIALSALHMDNSNAEAHRALANVHWFHHWDLAAAEQEFEIAAALSANNPVQQWGMFQFQGAVKEDHERAIAGAQSALDLDPLSVPMRVDAGWIFYWARRFDEAIAQCRIALDLNPHYPSAYWVLAFAELARSSPDEAIAILSRATEKFSDGYLLGALGLALGSAHQNDKACQILAELERRAEREWVSEVYFAWIHLGLNDTGRALDWLERACEERNPHALWLRVAPCYDRLRSETRFHRLVTRLNLPVDPSQSAKSGRAS
jgi:TolB-like protein